MHRFRGKSWQDKCKALASEVAVLGAFIIIFLAYTAIVNG